MIMPVAEMVWKIIWVLNRRKILETLTIVEAISKVPIATLTEDKSTWKYQTKPLADRNKNNSTKNKNKSKKSQPFNN
jgi:hypothetical protein